MADRPSLARVCLGRVVRVLGDVHPGVTAGLGWQLKSPEIPALEGGREAGD